LSLWLGLILLIALQATASAEKNIQVAVATPAPWPDFGPQAETSLSTQDAPLPAECAKPPGDNSLRNCIDENNDVVIGSKATNDKCKTTVVADQTNFALGKITIGEGGALLVPEQIAQQGIAIQTAGINVTGTLQIGSSACPIGSTSKASRVTITFTGNRPSCPNDVCDGSVKGIEVNKGGVLRMYGFKGVPDPNTASTAGLSWTYLTSPAGPLTYNGAAKVLAPVPAGGNMTLQVANDVSGVTASDATGLRGWKQDDWIAVATTSFSPYETEFVQLAADPVVSNGVSTLMLKQPLQFYHFGGEDPGQPSDNNYNAAFGKNFGIDERAEVGLISRNITLTADTPATGNSNHWGGELRFLKNYKEVSLQGVELQKFGKEQIGSYPIHFHMDGSTPTAPGGQCLSPQMKPVSCDSGFALINANSIDHSYNKCVTIHSTQNVTIQNNVCARIVGHIFYEEVGDEANITFNYNLGLGAMSNSFDINDGTDMIRNDLITRYWWPGDNLANLPGFNLTYDGFLIKDTDDQNNGTAGQCFKFEPNKTINTNGSFVPDDNGGRGSAPPCRASAVYLEPPSGFWIVNPSAILIGNSIGGCQGEGKGYWYVPPGRGPLTTIKFIPVGNYTGLSGIHGQFTNNRVHGCDSGLYSGDQQDITADALQPYLNGVKDNSHPVMAEFDGLTATRNRNRGAWLRPNFYTLKDARFATNRDDISLVTSGGPDGNYPGIYSLLTDSVTVGVSQNNVDRWGPCPTLVLGGNDATHVAGQVRGYTWGCIDRTSALKGQNGTGGDLIGNGYPSNGWNFAGYMIYDGPVLIFHDRFVNFKKDPTGLLTTDDALYLKASTTPVPTSPPPVNGIYEGDAALGWFQGNISSYPTASASEELRFDNVDFRHQVYTQQVNISSFNDGDKNTAILDLDGTLSGYQVVDSENPMNKLTDVHPISLNNLELNAAGGDPGGSVDECQATGGQDATAEGRATANMSPGEVGALEFEALYPPDTRPGKNRNDQIVTFQQDSTQFSGTFLENPKFALSGRDGQGVWEPKVTSGYGYTISASAGCPPGIYPGNVCPAAGIPKLVHVGIVDTVKPRISAADPFNPFYVRVGICYTGNANSHPASADLFTVTRGYKSWGGGGVDPTDSLLRPFYNQLDGQSNNLKAEESCFNLDHQNMRNLKTCPSVGVTPVPASGTCPAPSSKDPKRDLCIYPKVQLTRADAINCTPSITNCLNNNGTPQLDKYLYDSKSGWLFFYVAQTRPNARTMPPLTGGTAPLGSCTGVKSTDPFFCPSNTGGDSYYVCPPEGCWSYSVSLNDRSYSPIPSACSNPYGGNPDYSQPTPVLEGQLALGTVPVVRSVDGGAGGKFPHYIATTQSQPTTCMNPK
jgi:hypothetical protein